MQSATVAEGKMKLEGLAVSKGRDQYSSCDPFALLQNSCRGTRKVESPVDHAMCSFVVLSAFKGCSCCYDNFDLPPLVKRFFYPHLSPPHRINLIASYESPHLTGLLDPSAGKKIND